MNWLVFWIVVYLIIIVYLTLKHVKTKNVEAYLVNNRNTKTLPLVFTTLATFVGGGTSIGLMAMGYESGFAAVGIGVAYVIGFFILSRYAGKIRQTGFENRLYSFPQFLTLKYIKEKDTKFAYRFAAAVSGVNIFIFFFLLAAQFVGMASLLKFAFGIDYQYAAIISCMVVITYTAIAGLSGVIVTDMLQFVTILIMIILIFIPGIMADTNNLSLLSELPKSHLTGSYYGWIFLIALPLFLAPSVLVRLDIWQRLLAAKDQKTARKMSIYSGLGMLPFYIIFPLVGMAIHLVIPEAIDPKDVTYLFLARHSNSFILGFAVIGLISALMSSGDSFLNLISISAVNDFKLMGKTKLSPKQMQPKIRIATFIFGIIATSIALIFPKIVDLMVVGIGTIVIFVPATFLALTKDKVYKYKHLAFASILSGFVVNLIFFIWGVFQPESFEPKSSFIPAFLTALLVLLVGYFIKTKTHKHD
jgi:solute:Na+ symporter, SSS family